MPGAGKRDVLRAPRVFCFCDLVTGFYNNGGVEIMANLEAIHSFGASLISYLRNAHQAAFGEEDAFTFQLISSGEMALLENDGMDNTVTLYLYRITMNEHLRNTAHPNRPSDALPPLSVDLHYLLTIWASGSEEEHRVAAWVMHQLHHHPTLDVSSLSPDGEWGRDEVVQIIPAELSNEDMMRIWDSLAPSYRLSLSYIGRVVRIDPSAGDGARPVVAIRRGYTDMDAQKERP